VAAVGVHRTVAGPLPRARWARARDLCQPSAATLDLLLADLARAVSPWGEGWGVGTVTLRVLRDGGHVPSPGQAADLEWHPVAGPVQGEVLAWLASDRPAEPPVTVVTRALFGDVRGALARDVARDAWAELRAALSESLASRCVAVDSVESPAMAHRWSGVARVQLDWSARGLGRWWLLCRPRIAMTGTRGAPVGIGRASLVSLGEALALRRVPASVCLAAAELPLHALVRIRIGDLVGLSHRLDAPAMVRVGSDPTLCSLTAALARVGPAKAVVLVGRANAPGPSPSSNGDQMSASHDLPCDSQSPGRPVARWLDLPAAPSPSLHAPQLGVGLHPLLGVRARVEVRVGGFDVTVGELARAPVGAVFTLDRGFDDPVDVIVEGSVVARGQLVAVDDCFAVRLTEVPPPLVPGHDGDDADVR